MLSLPTTSVLSKWILNTYKLHVSTLLQVLKAAWTLLKFVLLWHFRICLFYSKNKNNQANICFTILLYLHKNTTIRLWKQGKLRMMFLFRLELRSSALIFVWLSIGSPDQWVALTVVATTMAAVFSMWRLTGGTVHTSALMFNILPFNYS